MPMALDGPDALNVSFWLRVLKKSDVSRILRSADRRTVVLLPPQQIAEAVLRYWPGWMRFCGMDQAIMGCGGGLVV